jgi:predicted dehydrogenase
MTYRASIIGVGNIGFKLGTDSKREGTTWSHAEAYGKCEKSELAAVVEVNPENAENFRQRYKDIPVFKSIREMMDGTGGVDIVSICTPTHTHHDILVDLLEYPIKGIFCEKPIASDIQSAYRMVEMCRGKKVALAVNHNRRWDDNYIYARDLIRDGKIGRVKAINALYPGQIFNIGTHLLDTVRMMISQDPEEVSGISFNLENDDPSVSGWVRFDDDVPCTVISTGRREDLILEIDVIGDEGRVKVLENGDKVKWYVFTESKRYSGYRELSPMPTESIAVRDRFVRAVEDIIDTIEGRKIEPECSGNDGYYSLSMSAGMLNSARNDGSPSVVRHKS